VNATRIYILERTSLADISLLDPSPRNGDVVVYLRPAQDPNNKYTGKLEDQGVSVIWGESLLNLEDSTRIDRLGAQFVDRWHYDGERDISLAGDLSLGEFVSPEIAARSIPWYLIRTGEIIRRALELHPRSDPVFSDLADGESLLRVMPKYLPLQSIATLVADEKGKTFRPVNAVNPLPSFYRRRDIVSWKRNLKSYLGGFRPRYLAARWRIFMRKLKRKPAPDIYLFLGRGIDIVAGKIIKRGKIRIAVDQPIIPGSEVLRFDHLFAIPKAAEISAAKRLLEHAATLEGRFEASNRFAFNGINYGPLLARTARKTLKQNLPITLFTLATVRKMQNILGFSSAVVAGEGALPGRSLVYLNKGTNVRLYFIRHGFSTIKCPFNAMGHNNPHVTYLACGDDHREEYGTHLPAEEKPRTIVTGSPLSVGTNAVSGKRSRSHRKRVLLLNYGFARFWTASRIRKIDTYTIDLFKVARNLIADGWTVGYRTHPEFGGHALERRLAGEMGLEGKIVWDSHPNYNSALLAYDVVVSNVSSTHYQALYAGWPTVFYEPVGENEKGGQGLGCEDFFVGLPVAKDIEQPIATDPLRLEELIRETLDPDSLTSVFPHKFFTEHAHRFIGPRPDESDAVIAEFLESELLGPFGHETGKKEQAA